MKHLLPNLELPFTVLISGSAFFVLFLLIIVLVYRKERRQAYEETSMLPLDDSATATPIEIVNAKTHTR
jgi:cbb3-type cytochrome oxidase subunit 3